MSILGDVLLACIFLLLSFAVVFGLTALKLEIETARRSLAWARQAVFVGAGLSVVALISLAIAFLMNDFSIAAVSQYSSTDLPFFYKLSAVWAGSAGSLLLWSVGVFVLFGLWLAKSGRESYLVNRESPNKETRDMNNEIRNTRFEAAALSIGSAICLGFSAVLLFVAKPFASCPVTVDDGMGLNPLLQNFWMIIHPPLLFVGYSAFLIPYVLVSVSVFTGRAAGSAFRRQLRRWLLFGICFLGLGIATGAKWSYVELGWGGYWAWDPVENASLLPWLVAVAALHSLAGARVADKFRLWAIVLAPVPFILCLVATFITRSGVLASVHSFDQNVMFSALLTFIACCFSLWAACTIRAVKSISISPSRMSSFSLDKSEMLSWANIVFISTAAIIAAATFWPIVSRVAVNSYSSLTPTRAFYDRVISVVGILLASLVGLSTLADLQKRSGFISKLLACGAAALLCFGLVLYVHEKQLLTSCACGICAFGFVAVSIKLWLSLSKSGKIGGGIAHLGLLLLVVAAGFSSTEKAVQTPLTKGEEITLDEYTIVYDSFTHKSLDGITKVGPEIVVRKKGLAKKLWPHNNLYPNGQISAEVAVLTGLFEDIYVSFDGVTPEARVVITAKIKPLMLWLWLAAMLIVAGPALALLEDRGRKTKS